MKKTAALLSPFMLLSPALGATLFDGVYAGAGAQMQLDKVTTKGNASLNGTTLFQGTKKNNTTNFNPTAFAGYGLVTEDIFYFGGEVSYTFAPKKTRIQFNNPALRPQTYSNKNTITASARAGMLVAENILVYGAAGLQAQQTKAEGQGGKKDSATLAATPAAGVEVMVTDMFGIRLEGAASVNLTPGPKVEQQNATQTTNLKTSKDSLSLTVGLIAKVFSPPAFDPASLGVPEIPELPAPPSMPPAPEPPAIF